MTCIAGTVEEPKDWVRLRAGEPERHAGRWCDRKQPFTSRRMCSSCPAYRGVRWDGTLATGIAPNGDIVSLSADDYREYEAATEASFDGDDGPWRIFMARLEDGMGARALRAIGDPDAQDRWAGYMRAYRARMDEEQKARQRAAKREYMREYMRRRREAAVSVSNPTTP